MYFSRTFKALNFDFQIQGLLRTFKVHAKPGTWHGVILAQCEKTMGYLPGFFHY